MSNEMDFDANDYAVQVAAEWLTERLADDIKPYDPLMSRMVQKFNYFLQAEGTVLDVARIQSDDQLPQDYKNVISLLTIASKFSGFALPADIPVTAEQAWEYVNNAPDNIAPGLTKDQLYQYLSEKYPDVIQVNQDGTLSPPDFIFSPPSEPVLPDSTPPHEDDRPVAPYVEVAVPLYDSAPGQTSPLVLDIDGNGVQLTALHGTGAVFWDIDKDGFAEASGWVTDGDGLLCIDANGNGYIDDQGELFGNDATYANGFAALAAYDSNNDNNITSADAQFANLLVWVDANGDGISQSDELHTLSSLGITSISTAYSNVDYAIAGNTIKQESGFVINGQTRSIVDAWFSYDNVNSIYAQDYTLDFRTLSLPTQRGYGNLPDLHIAMSLNESLLDKVQALATASAANIMDPAFDLVGKIADILYTWAGVENIDPSSRGPYIDARTLSFLEVFMDKPYIWEPNGSPNPTPCSIPDLMLAWQTIFNNVAGHLLVQSESIFDLISATPIYDPLADTVDGGNFSAVLGTSNSEYLYGTDSTDLILGYDASDTLYGYGGGDTLIGGDGNDLLYGGTGDDLLKGGEGGDTLHGEEGNDTLQGDAGNDYLYGYDGNDVLEGGAGYDTLYGGIGDDTYRFAAGFGIATSYMADYGSENLNEGTDTVAFVGGILPEDVRAWVDNGGTLHFRLAASADDEVSFSGQIGAGGVDINSRIERVTFDNGTVWDLTQGLLLTDTDDAHIIYGSAQADVIDGRGGNDTLYGYDGNDILEGGAGYDTLYGGLGDDTYRFAAGFGIATSYMADYGSENLNEGTDTVAFVGGILPADVRTWVDNGGALHFRLASSADDEVTFFGQVAASGTDVNSRIERVTFDNGTVWDLTQGLLLTDTDDAHITYGSAQADVIDGRGGNDTLYGYDGNDILEGGAGYDYLQGGLGDDTYRFAAGFGIATSYMADYGSENLNEGTDTVAFVGGILPGDVRAWVDTSGALHFRLASNADDEVSFFGQVAASGTDVNSRIERVTFDNGTVWDLTQGLLLTDTDDAHAIYGSAQADMIDGRGGSDYLYGKNGNDTLTGGTGSDYLYGGAGNDVYKWGMGNAADYVQEESGSADKILILPGLTPENLVYSVVNTYDLKITSALNSADNITISGEFNTGGPGYAVETVEFSDGFSMNLTDYNNWIKGTSSAETLNGDPGGVTRNDTILGGAGNDAINGKNGSDTISGDAGADTIHGNGGNDFLHGGSGNDILYGDAGNDVLWGGLGADTLTGGTGADRFVFDSSTASSDTIKDFSPTEDILDLSHLISGFDPVTQAITDFVQITDSGANSIVKVDVDGTANGVNFVQVATLQNVTGLTDEAALMNSGHLLAA